MQQCKIAPTAVIAGNVTLEKDVKSGNLKEQLAVELLLG